jgi:hypothetical protein
MLLRDLYKLAVFFARGWPDLTQLMLMKLACYPPDMLMWSECFVYRLPCQYLLSGRAQGYFSPLPSGQTSKLEVGISINTIKFQD